MVGDVSGVLHSLLLVCPMLCFRGLWSELSGVLFMILWGVLGCVCGGCLTSGGVNHCVAICVLVSLGSGCWLFVCGREGRGVKPLSDRSADRVPG